MKIPGASRSIGRGERNTSRRHAGGDHLTVEFRSDEPGPEDLRLAAAHGWLHIACQEDMKNVVSQEGHEQKAFDSAGIMLEDVIGVPFVGQLIEAIILSHRWCPKWAMRSTGKWASDSVVTQIQSLC